MWQAGARLGGGAPKNKPGVAAQLLTRFWEMFCQHRFSWPHTGVHGQDYQVCVLCGAAYQYDWTTMRRTGRLAASADVQHESLSGNSAESPD